MTIVRNATARFIVSSNHQQLSGCCRQLNSRSRELAGTRACYYNYKFCSQTSPRTSRQLFKSCAIFAFYMDLTWGLTLRLKLKVVAIDWLHYKFIFGCRFLVGSWATSASRSEEIWQLMWITVEQQHNEATKIRRVLNTILVRGSSVHLSQYKSGTRRTG